MGTGVQLLGFHQPLANSDPHESTPADHSPDDERFVIAHRGVMVDVVEVQPRSGIAFAVDAQGRRFALTADSAGVDVRQLRSGQRLIGDASRFAFILAARVQ